MFNSKAAKERTIENHLRFYNAYKIGIKNCEKQLEYIMPSLVSRYEVSIESGESFWIVNNTEKVALDRIESKHALDLKEQIEHFTLITASIDAALLELKPEEMDFVNHRYFCSLPIQEVKQVMGYSEEKSVYRIRRRVLEKLLISLQNLLLLK